MSCVLRISFASHATTLACAVHVLTEKMFTNDRVVCTTDRVMDTTDREVHTTNIENVKPRVSHWSTKYQEETYEKATTNDAK